MLAFATVGRRKRASLNYIKERVWNKLQGWKERLLSQAGREVLLKAVVQAIPTYAMSCFKLPVGLCEDIEKLIRKFWWGECGDRRRIHWKNWETLCKHKAEGGLGFKELIKFNEAMLAKQVWRLHTDKSSLLFRVFSTKYFPSGSVFNAKKLHGSYALQSIWKARKVIERGMQWRIGNGSLVRVFHDNWIPGQFPTKAVPHRSETISEVKVSSLIDPDLREWNVGLLENSVALFLIQKILAIPVCKTNQEDMLFWPRSKDGSYTVKSGYQLLCELEKSDEASSSNTTGTKAFWNRIWKLNIPNKMRFFCWRACSEALPTLQGLYKRKVVNSPICGRCGIHEETTLHALWDCTAIQSVWGLNFKAIRNESHGISYFSDLIDLVALHQEDLELFVVVAWSIWFTRNKGRVNEPCTPLNKIFDAARATLFEFQTRKVPRQPVASSTTVRWNPPRAELYKINYDGAVLKESGEAGLGVVIRNEKGEVMGSLAEKIILPDNIEVLEALAARRGILFAIELGLQRVIIEGDSEIVFKALSESCSDCSHIGHIIKDCKSISSLFQTHSFSHTRRQGNAVAHALAKRARNSSPLLVWMESVPPDVAYLVHVDVIS